MKKILKDKKLLLLTMLPMLTGCNTTEYVYYGGDFFNFMQAFDNSVTNFFLDLLEFINMLVVQSMFNMKDIAGNSYNTVVSFFESITNFSGIINVVSFLAVCAIIVRFAYSVFKNNLSEADNRYAPDILTVFKKVVVASIAAFAVPYCIITGFLVASAGGVMVHEAIFKETNLVSFEVYDAMQDNGVSFSTYCSVGQEKAGVKDLSDLYGYDVEESKKGAEGMQIQVITPQSQIATPNGTSAYSYYCQGNGGLGEDQALNVWQAFLKSPNTKGVIAIGGNNNAAANAGGAVFSVVGSVLTAIGSLFVFIIASYCILKRLVDVLMLIFMSWWYIGGSVSDLGSESLSALIRKTLSLMLTQFLFCFELAIFLGLTLQITDVFQKGLMMIIVGMVLLGTPTVVQELVTGTGGTGEAVKFGGGAVRSVKNFLGK